MNAGPFLIWGRRCRLLDFKSAMPEQTSNPAEAALSHLREDLAEIIARNLDPAPLNWPAKDGRRDLFGIPPDLAYLDWAYMGALPAAARKALAWAVIRRNQPWRIERRDFFDELEACRSLFGLLIGCDMDSVAVVAAASYGIAIAASIVAKRAPGRIIVPDQEHYSNFYAWRRLERSGGWEVVVVRRAPEQTWTDAMLAEIEEGCAVLAAPACHWSDGSLFDVPRLVNRARQAGAVTVIDATQTLGAIPFAVDSCRPDFLVASAYKWLLGPYGMAYLYVDPSHHQAEPIEGHAYHRAGAEGRATAIEYTDNYRAGARRFDSGQRADFVNLPHAVAGLAQLLTWTIPAVADVCSTLIGRVAEQARGAGLTTAVPLPGMNIIGVRRSAGWPADILPRLRRAGVKVSLRGDSVRVSPFVANGTNDVDGFFEALGRLGLVT